MAYTKYSLTPANNNATPPDGAPEGMLPSAVNDTMRDMMAQIRDVGDGIRNGTYTMTAPVITGGSITGSTINNSAIGGTTANSGAFTTLSASGATTFSGATVVSGSLTANTFSSSGATITGGSINGTAIGGSTAAAGTFTSLSDSGNLTFTGTGNRITGDFSNATLANRVMFQTSTSNSATVVGAIPSGTSLASTLLTFANSDPTNTSFGAISANGSTGLVSIISGVTGSGTALPLVMLTGGSERLRIDTSGNVGIGNTPAGKLDVGSTSASFTDSIIRSSTTGISELRFADTTINAGFIGYEHTADAMKFGTATTERMRIESGGNVLVGTTVYNDAFKGILLSNNGRLYAIADGSPPLTINRLTNDGDLVEFKQAGTVEGTISVSGTTVSYNGGHLSRYAQTIGAKDESLVKGTVLSNLDEMNEYVDAEGNLVANEQLNKVKVSDIEGDANVAGVFVNWSHDEAHNVDEINMAMTGDMIIRIAQGVVVQKGNLLMSAGDGTAKPQGDDIIRSKTIAKVTSNHITCTYEDGSYCVPCVLMAC